MVNLTATLPLRVLCQLVLSTPEVPHQESSIVITVNQQPLQQIQSESVSLPEGYVPHPDIGLAYKFHNEENVTWPEARKRCNAEGGNLAVIDSQLKLGYAIQQIQPAYKTHVGLLRLYDNTQWTSVVTGLPLNSIPWRAGEPSGDHDCGRIAPAENGIENYECSDVMSYICEFPIPKN